MAPQLLAAQRRCWWHRNVSLVFSSDPLPEALRIGCEVPLGPILANLGTCFRLPPRGSGLLYSVARATLKSGRRHF